MGGFDVLCPPPSVLCSNEVSSNEKPMILMPPYAFYHKNIDLHFLSKTEFSLERIKIFAWFFGILLYSWSLKKCQIFVENSQSFIELQQSQNLKSRSTFSVNVIFLNFVEMFVLTKRMKQPSFAFQIIFPCSLFHIRSNLFQWNFLNWRADHFNVVLHKKWKVS